MDSPRSQSGCPFRFPRRHRLKSPIEIRRVLRDESSQRRRFGAFSIAWSAIEAECAAGPQFAFVVSRAHGPAVMRNRIKRRLREAVRLNRSSWPNSAHHVVVRPNGEQLLTVDFGIVQVQMRDALDLIAGHKS